jgi:hypothetical protein
MAMRAGASLGPCETSAPHAFLVSAEPTSATLLPLWHGPWDVFATVDLSGPSSEIAGCVLRFTLDA